MTDEKPREPKPVDVPQIFKDAVEHMSPLTRDAVSLLLQHAALEHMEAQTRLLIHIRAILDSRLAPQSNITIATPGIIKPS